MYSGIKAPGLEKLHRAAVLFMFLTVPLAVWTGSYNPVYIKEIFITASMLILWTAFGGSKEIRINYPGLLVLLIPAWMLLSSFFSPYKAQALPVICLALALSVIFIVMANQTALPDKVIRGILMITALPAAAIGLIQVFFPSLSPGLLAFNQRIPSTLGNPNFFGAYLVVLIPFIIPALDKAGRGRSALVFAALAAALFLLYKTGSKAAIAGLVVEMAVLWLVQGYKNLKKSTVPVMIAAAAVIILSVMLLRNTESVKFRANVWSGTIKLAASNPLTGTGPGSFSFAFPAFRPGEIMKKSYMHSYEVSFPENILLQAAAEYGIPGVALLMVLLWLILKKPDPAKKDFYAAFCGLLAVNMAGVDINYGTSAMFAAVLGGVIMNGGRGTEKPIGPWMKKGVFFAVTAMAAAIIAAQVKFHVSDIYLKRAVDLSESMQWQAAVMNYKKALIYNPSNVPAGYFLGSAYFDSNPETNAPAAIAQLETVEKKAPDYVLLHYKKAGILNYMGRTAEAVEEYKKMLKLDPYLKPALTELAYIYYREGDLVSAEDYMKQAADLGRDAGLYNNLGNIYFMQKRVSDAIEAYKKAIEIKPDKDYYYNLGCVYFTLNDIVNAKENIFKAMELGSKEGNIDPKVENMVRQIQRYEKAMIR